MMFVMKKKKKKTFISTDMFCEFWSIFLNFQILYFFFNDLNNRITWQIDLMAFKRNYPVIYGVWYPFQTNFTLSSYWF